MLIMYTQIDFEILKVVSYLVRILGMSIEQIVIIYNYYYIYNEYIIVRL